MEPYNQFQNQAIGTIYDPPHHLKCTRKLFLKHNVHFESQLLDSQLPAIDKWENIEKLYKRDKPYLICSLYKLTDTYLDPVIQCAMKLSLAAQVMSRTVAAGIYSLVASGTEVSSFIFHKKLSKFSNVT